MELASCLGHYRSSLIRLCPRYWNERSPKITTETVHRQNEQQDGSKKRVVKVNTSSGYLFPKATKR